MKSDLKSRLAMACAGCVIGALMTVGVAICVVANTVGAEQHSQSSSHDSQPWWAVALILVGVSIGFLSQSGARRVAERKNLDPRKYAQSGAVGLIRAMVAKPAASGLRAVRCPHCRTDQDIPRAHCTFGCRCCGLISSAPRVKGRAYAG